MSRLTINIEHSSDGKLAFGVQSDNADQQVALLQHQLAASTREMDKIRPLADEADELRGILAHREDQIAELNGHILDLSSKLEAKKPKRRQH